MVLLDIWPGQMRTVYGDHDRFVETYFLLIPVLFRWGRCCVMKMVITGSRAGSMMSSMYVAIEWVLLK